MLALCASAAQGFALGAFSDSDRSFRSVPLGASVSIMERWMLEFKMREEAVMPEDGVIDVDQRVTDDSLSGPFQLSMHAGPAEESANEVSKLHEVIDWLRRSPPRIGVFVLHGVDGSEEALSVVEKFPQQLMVRGFVFSPFLDVDSGETRDVMQCELLRMAREARIDVIFRH